MNLRKNTHSGTHANRHIFILISPHQMFWKIQLVFESKKWQTPIASDWEFFFRFKIIDRPISFVSAFKVWILLLLILTIWHAEACNFFYKWKCKIFIPTERYFNRSKWQYRKYYDVLLHEHFEQCTIKNISIETLKLMIKCKSKKLLKFRNDASLVNSSGDSHCVNWELWKLDIYKEMPQTMMVGQCHNLNAWAAISACQKKQKKSMPKQNNFL